MYIGMDLGGTSIKAGIVTSRGVLKKKLKVSTEHHSKKKLLATLKEVITTLGEGEKIQGIGISVPGFHSSYAMSHSNIKILDGMDLKKALGIKVPVRLENDARCFVLAEWHHGAAKRKRNVIGITIGTFLGTGMILNGKLYSGANGHAGELAWTTVNALDVAKKNVKPQSWAFGGRYFMSQYRKRGGKAKLVSEMWKEKSRAAQRTKTEAVRLLALHTLNLVKTFDPDVIVFGGGISTPTVLKDIRKQVKLYAKEWPSVPKIVLSEYGSFDSVIGATMLFK